MSIPQPESLVGTPPATPPLPSVPSPESVLGQVGVIPGVSIGQRGGLRTPHLPRFARGRAPRAPFHREPGTAPAAPAQTTTTVNVRQAPPPRGAGPHAPGTEIPHELGQQAPTQPSAADRFRRVLSRMNPSQRQSVRDMAARQRSRSTANPAAGLPLRGDSPELEARMKAERSARLRESAAALHVGNQPPTPPPGNVAP